MSRPGRRPDLPATQALQSALDLVAAGGPAGIFGLVTQDGATVFTGSAGTADLTEPRAIRPTDRFRVASITKTFVATVVLQLVAEHRLTVTDPLGDHLPGLVPHDRKITVEHLLSMRSGLPDYVPDVFGDPPNPANLRRHFAPEELVALALTHPMRHAPGTQVTYCNTDYILLGLIVEHVTGQRIDTQLRRRIFSPLDLAETELPTRDPHIRGPHSSGYMQRGADEPVLECTDYDPSEAWTSGAIVSTPHEVARFLDALLTGALLPARQLAAMRSVRRWTDDLDYGYGLAHHRLPGGGPAVYGHGGTHFGVECHALRSDSGRTVVVYRNCWQRHAPLPLDNPFTRTAFGVTFQPGQVR